MTIKSWLFAPADSERKLAKLAQCGADAVILDLEDAVAPQMKAEARRMARDWLATNPAVTTAGKHPLARYVRINALSSPHWRADLAMVMQGAPDGVFVPKSGEPEFLQPLVAELYELEQKNGLPRGSTAIIPMIGEDPASALGIRDYLSTSLPRLAGLAWGSEDLASALGASRKRDNSGEWTGAFRLVRDELLLVAKARRIKAIDTVEPDFSDLDALSGIATRSASDGFDSMLCIHPAQVHVVNAAFTPDADRLAQARAIVEAFSAEPGAAALTVDGRMVERPHLEQARKLLSE